MAIDDTVLVVHGTTCSYFTGKLEAYLRAKGIAYRLAPFTPQSMRRCAKHTGVMQIPQVECPDGSWLVDTTLIIEHLEATAPEPRVLPPVPVVAFAARLIEDYADEWLWRPAMHYRWSYPDTAQLMSAWLAEHLAGWPLPEGLKRRYWRHRQFKTFVRGDGVSAETRAAVEDSYLQSLDMLEAIFAQRPFLLGQRPTQADFGFFGPMFRHFFSDPAPGRIMRERAPGVHEWVARMWNLRPDRFHDQAFPEALPEDLGPLLHTIATVYLPYLEANAQAWAGGEKRVRYRVQDTDFQEPTKPYRVWCRDRIREQYLALDEADQATIRQLLDSDATVQQLAVASPRPVENLVGTLPIAPDRTAKAHDSWWR